MKRIQVQLRRFTARWGRDVLAIAGIGSIAVGLSLISLTVALVVVGLYLLIASSSGRRIA